MSKVKVSDYIAKRLKEIYKIDNVFMVSGGGAMHLNDSLGRYIPYVCNHHEQACAMAAEGYARVGQKLAVVNVTTGPGGLNCLNGVFGQWTDSVPVLYLSGQVKLSTTTASCPEISLRQLGDQEVDIVKIISPLTKYSKMITDPKEIKYHLDRAIHEATTGRFGPVWLDIPMDIQGAVIDEADLIDFSAEQETENKKQEADISKIIEKLSSSKRPLIIAGHGIRLSKQEEIFYELLKKLNIPVVTTFNGFDLLDNNHPNYIGRIGTIGQRAGNFALQNADLVLCLGTRNNVRQVSYSWENFVKNAFKIVVDIDKAELDKPTLIPDLKIHADLKDFLPALNSNLCKIQKTDWLNFCQNLKEKYSFENTKEYQNNDDKINPYYFIHQLTKQMDANDTCVATNGSACVCAFQVGEIKKGQRIFWNSGDASMGYDLPAAIGACIASNKKNTICIAGDGSIMMNLQELQTIKHHNLPIKIFVLNNDGYVSIKQTQKNFFQGHMTASGRDSGVSFPDFAQIAKAFGIKSIKISECKNIEEQIEEVLKADRPIICEVVIKSDYNFIPKLSAKKLEDGTIISPSLEDMFPFLDRAEYEENMIEER